MQRAPPVVSADDHIVGQWASTAKAWQGHLAPAPFDVCLSRHSARAPVAQGDDDGGDVRRAIRRRGDLHWSTGVDCHARLQRCALKTPVGVSVVRGACLRGRVARRATFPLHRLVGGAHICGASAARHSERSGEGTVRSNVMKAHPPARYTPRAACVNECGTFESGGIDRPELFADDDSSQPFSFHGWRHTH